MTVPPRGSTRTGISREYAYTVRFCFETVFFELKTFFFLFTVLVDVAGLGIWLSLNVCYCKGKAWIYYTEIWNSMVLLLKRGKYCFYKLYG